MTFRTVIIGGDAAGMSAATRVRGLRSDAEIVVLEKSRFTSYSACGIPFLVGGLVSGGVDRLVARTPEEHRERGLDVRIHHEALSIDVDAGEVVAVLGRGADLARGAVSGGVARAPTRAGSACRPR